ncbi:UDP-3-O-(3-hydroxymyristoyl)glucosamine N-acyltransferase [Aestuariibacter salexigens]|uniref:UDP-3-O-(3-hydroxymyristoyl)glucosamine N-acyltransferase n=1 Tax=Aestuariibacter salexigens TaxID=226010 RepID=UPI0004019251|nr:UDP-3-O-(3-hydroxymyristoyl)glucosamine N-acyltransferase [Aestuariibacter salexigens]
MAKAYSLGQLAAILDAELIGNEEVTVSQVATLQSAGQQQLAFLANSKYRKHLQNTNAAAVLVSPDEAQHCTTNALVLKDPYVAFAKVAQLLDSTPPVAQDIAPTAYVHPSASLGRNVALGHNVVIEADAVLGDNVQVGSGAVIGQGSRLGKGCKIYPNVTIYHHCEIGDDVTVHSGTVVGSDGFGYANEAGNWLKIPQTGRVVIGDGTEIGANTCIDRGAIDDTIIGKNVIIDNQVQIAHNCQIGDHSCLCGLVGIAGSTTLGKYVVIGGSSGVNGHISICDKVQITGFSMVTRDITEPGVYSSGSPAAPNREWRRNAVRLKQLDSLFERVKQLETAVQQGDE